MSFLADVLAFTSKKYLEFLTYKKTSIIFISERMIHVRLNERKGDLFYSDGLESSLIVRSRTTQLIYE